jgi:riboflavin kinase / FMN adenylyltransferase
MKLIRSLDDVPAQVLGRALAVGTFDGVHLGHRRVIVSALEAGRSRGLVVSVVTFDPHPLEVLRPEDPPRLLTTTPVKIDRLRELDVDEIVVIPFTREFSRLEPEQFCREALARTLRASHVSVGANFRFGRGASGDPELLRRCGDFETAVVPLLEVEGEPVSSSRIRKLVEKGEVAAARALLGAPFELEGTVVEGDARGRGLGMPTANVVPEPAALVPAPGIYAGAARGHAAAISVGVRPTFETGGDLLVEAYLLDFDGDLYGETLRLSFLERLRDEERFDSADQLVEQMRRDVERVRELSGLC